MGNLNYFIEVIKKQTTIMAVLAIDPTLVFPLLTVGALAVRTVVSHLTNFANIT
jgi:hypothetical protein